MMNLIDYFADIEFRLYQIEQDLKGGTAIIDASDLSGKEKTDALADCARALHHVIRAHANAQGVTLTAMFPNIAELVEGV
jgi:hypothetical protein